MKNNILIALLALAAIVGMKLWIDAFGNSRYAQGKDDMIVKYREEVAAKDRENRQLENELVDAIADYETLRLEAQAQRIAKETLIKDKVIIELKNIPAECRTSDEFVAGRNTIRELGPS